MSYGQHGSALSGTIAAATSGTLWTLTYPGVDPALALKIKRMHVQVTTIVAFGTLVTAGRALRLVLGAPLVPAKGEPSGGSEWQMRPKLGGDGETLGRGHVSTTAALTTTGIEISADARRRISLVHIGAAGAMIDEEWRFDDADGPLYLRVGRTALIQTDSALDATGTIQLKVDVDAEEVTL
jgi:hypothetical protein